MSWFCEDQVVRRALCSLKAKHCLEPLLLVDALSSHFHMIFKLTCPYRLLSTPLKQTLDLMEYSYLTHVHQMYLFTASHTQLKETRCASDNKLKG
jgi:hypothetical protein